VKIVSFVIKKKIRNYTYVYEVTSYRDENGEPRNKQVPIGKIDAQGEIHYKPGYIDRMMEAGTPLDIKEQTLFSEQEIKDSVIKEYGAYYFLESIACSIGLSAPRIHSCTAAIGWNQQKPCLSETLAHSA
jgi:hypothetical protein